MQGHDITFDIGHMTLAAKVWGQADGLPVLALHGWLDNAATFDRIAPLLPQLHLVAMDLPGHGLSSHRPDGMPYYFWDYVADVINFVDSLGWQQFALVGHSMGAGVASMVAGCIPEKITKLALIEGFGPLTDDPDNAPDNFMEALAQSQQLSGKAMPIYRSIDDAVDMRKKGVVGDISEVAARLLVNRNIQSVGDGYTWRSDPRLKLRSPLRLTEDQAVAFFKKIIAPTCLILANDGFFSSPSIYTKYAERLGCIKDIQIERLEGGHHLHIEEQAPEVADVLARFFRD